MHHGSSSTLRQIRHRRQWFPKARDTPLTEKFSCYFQANDSVSASPRLASSCPCNLSRKTRHTCASALCKVALRFPEPVRFDAYCFLKGLADAADMFPLVANDRRRDFNYLTDDADGDDNADGDATRRVEDRAVPEDEYWREQEELAERIQAGEMSRGFSQNGYHKDGSYVTYLPRWNG